MISKAYSFFDTKTGIYSAPFFMLHEGAAIRTATELANDLGTTIGRHPGDFQLRLVGEFDDNIGAIGSVGPATVLECSSLVKTRPVDLFKETI
jgi:hypothetical protein